MEVALLALLALLGVLMLLWFAASALWTCLPALWAILRPTTIDLAQKFGSWAGTYYTRVYIYIRRF